jgi:hypothetical protein
VQKPTRLLAVNAVLDRVPLTYMAGTGRHTAPMVRPVPKRFGVDAR